MSIRTMRGVLPCYFLIGLLAASPAFAQGTLPASFSNWSSTESKAAIAEAESATLREYGMKFAERRTYTRGSESRVATAYSFNDPSGAYGA
ncbi:MAG: hypothetical protein ACRD37_05840, partial [Candidatus Acidiferrales bacterium]